MGYIVMRKGNQKEMKGILSPEMITILEKQMQEGNVQALMAFYGTEYRYVFENMREREHLEVCVDANDPLVPRLDRMKKRFGIVRVKNKIKTIGKVVLAGALIAGAISMPTIISDGMIGDFESFDSIGQQHLQEMDAECIANGVEPLSESVVKAAQAHQFVLEEHGRSR